MVDQSKEEVTPSPDDIVFVMREHLSMLAHDRPITVHILKWDPQETRRMCSKSIAGDTFMHYDSYRAGLPMVVYPNETPCAECVRNADRQIIYDGLGGLHD